MLGPSEGVGPVPGPLNDTTAELGRHCFGRGRSHSFSTLWRGQRYGSLYDRTRWDENRYVHADEFLETERRFFFKTSYLFRN